jgi:hypothetical protein
MINKKKKKQVTILPTTRKLQRCYLKKIKKILFLKNTPLVKKIKYF